MRNPTIPWNRSSAWTRSRSRCTPTSGLRVHYTPKHGSWLNQAEIEISLFSRQCLGKRRIPTLGILRHEACAWNHKVNRLRVKINWQFTRKRARAKFGYKRNLLRRSHT